MNRRALLAAGLGLAPLAAALLAACARDPAWPDGMVPIKWDRDTCTRCRMVISDRRFAAQMRGGPRATVFNFDDIGCAVSWLRDKAREHPWMSEPASRLWVADIGSPGEKWLPAPDAHYLGGRTSPMAYNQAASGSAQPGSVDFETMRQRVLGQS